jgi:hypothetical protein
MGRSRLIILRLPETKPGRRSAEDQANYERDVIAFCQGILQIKSRIEFEPSTRGWCHVCEEHGLDKGDFDRAEALITRCRKLGLLPLDIVCEDIARTSSPHEPFHNCGPEEFIRQCVTAAREYADTYQPEDFWATQDVYLSRLAGSRPCGWTRSMANRRCSGRRW